ncbi:MAG: PEP-CTERM sorting domain-containing protein [Gammaproteobacteria bacterium]|nr:PEP-CTERM sorting domain-containing protein [Gammaproteobacteria bacterium]
MLQAGLIPNTIKSWLRTLVVFTGLTVTLASPAATVTTNELALDSVFSQALLVNRTIDIRFDPIVSIVNSSLLTIDTSTQLDTLFGLAPKLSPTVNLFFVDNLSFCGGTSNPNLIGCGDISGNRIVVKSGSAAGGNGGALIAHELGHNLGLDHLFPDSGTNLMNATISGNTSLDQAQVDAILGSPLIQFAGSQRFIDITPILITAVAAVPLPAGSLLLLSALLVIGFVASRRRRNALPTYSNPSMA